jgi:hypothetical protein
VFRFGDDEAQNIPPTPNYSHIFIYKIDSIQFFILNMLAQQLQEPVTESAQEDEIYA